LVIGRHSGTRALGLQGAWVPECLGAWVPDH